MLVALSFIRVIAAFSVLKMCLSEIPSRKRAIKPAKYPLEVHQLFRQQAERKIPKATGVWSAWSTWSPCSRTCGGGVTYQTRNCISRPADSKFGYGLRRRRQNGKLPLANSCIGLYKRIHICNTQECPPGSPDFRSEQCTAFNKRPFKGKFYAWEPYLQAGQECKLNCRAIGMDFYATLNRTAIDGTRCKRPQTFHGRLAPAGTYGVCISGQCKVVGSNGVVGSLEGSPEECAACLKGTCKSFNGIYMKPDLNPGYTLITQIPQGACRIIVQQLKHTKNFIALRDTNGTFILNGDWKFSNSKTFEAAGTKFTYLKQDVTSVETVTSPGPLAHNVDIMLVYNQPNPGIKYSFSLPVQKEQIAPPFMKRPPIDSALVEPRRLDPPLNTLTNQRDEAKAATEPRAAHRRLRRRKFTWKITGVTACSKSCGGGLQTTVVTCVRELTQTAVLEKRCGNVERPSPQTIKCNVQDCPPHWGGHWDTCTGSCGQGVQKYILQCEQDLNGGRTAVVSESSCPRPKPEETSRPCELPPCENTIDNELHQALSNDVRSANKEWTVGPWSECSVTCGKGYRTRSIICPGGECRPEERPSHAEYCDSGECVIPSSTESSPWLLSEWSQCSELCGTGTQSRLAVCSKDHCESKPETSRACSSDKTCTGQWFVGPWGTCSDSCNGSAVQKREAFCIVKVRGQSRIMMDMTCSANTKPETERPCTGSCPARWVVGDWGICEGMCPSGIQRREVRCVDALGKPSNACADGTPPAKRTCACHKRHADDSESYKPAQDEPTDHNCIDKIRNCYLAVQARLCQYPYYINHCCVSCKKAQDSL